MELHTAGSDSNSGRTKRNPAPLLGWQILLGGFILGILALRYHVGSAAGLGLLLLLVQFLRQGRPHSVALLIAFLLGLGWAHVRLPEEPASVPDWMVERSKVLVTAHVDKVQSRPGGRVQLYLSEVRCTPQGGEEELLSGRLLWTWEKPLLWPEAGQSVEGIFRILPVREFRNPGGFTSEFHLQREGVFYRTFTFRDKVEVTFSPARAGIRSTLRDRFTGAVTGQGGAILAAVLLGERYFLSQTTVELMQKSSLSHSLAQSGLHLGLVVTMGLLLAWLAGILWPSLLLVLPRSRLAVLLALPPAIFYVWLGQGSPSLLRAGLMFLFWGLLLFLGRERVLIDGLFMALTVILLISPLSAFDLSLQLSAVAVAGITLFWPIFNGWISRLKATRGGAILFYPLTLLSVSVAANLALLPIMLSAFGFASPHLLLNLVWLPLLGFIVLPLGAVGLGLVFVPGLEGAGAGLLWVSSVTAEGMVGLLAWMNDRELLPVVWSMRPTWPLCMAYWLMLLFFVVRKRADRSARNLLLVSIVGLVLSFAAGRVWESRHDVSLTLLDVGQGQAALLEVGARRILIDGGGSFNPEFDFGRAVIGPVLTWGRLPRVEGIVLSHPHSDHLRGLFHPLANFKVGFFAANNDLPAGVDLELLQKSLERGGLAHDRWKAGERIDLGRGLVLEVLHPEQSFRGKGLNDRSLVLRVVKDGNGLILMPGDLEQRGQRHLLGQGIDLSAQVLVLPHHGSKSSLHRDFYQAVGPEVALCSNGYLNHFLFPHAEVLKELSGLDIPILRTDMEGAITITWSRDGALSLRTQQRGRIDIKQLKSDQ
jgi:competence protein ComEC